MRAWQSLDPPPIRERPSTPENGVSNTGISNEELNIEAQRAALKAHRISKEEHQKKGIEPGRKKCKSKNRKHSKNNPNDTLDSDESFVMPYVTRHNHSVIC